ncbi:hypothetical protein SMB34_16440 [Thalassospira permensis NBRC 106175]|uniref:Uncharacterized protein n=1 Tax=Thalassospira permensis NBRC 106175 TaxID=1353532 RepID=A0ABR4TQH4_9PROT|nr:hypothetical protein SMB34_16440 [Thalassospira permensis NBRC 106175]
MLDARLIADHSLKHENTRHEPDPYFQSLVVVRISGRPIIVP